MLGMSTNVCCSLRHRCLPEDTRATINIWASLCSTGCGETSPTSHTWDLELLTRSLWA